MHSTNPTDSGIQHDEWKCFSDDMYENKRIVKSPTALETH